MIGSTPFDVSNTSFSSSTIVFLRPLFAGTTDVPAIRDSCVVVLGFRFGASENLRNKRDYVRLCSYYLGFILDQLWILPFWPLENIYILVNCNLCPSKLQFVSYVLLCSV
ncbi:hypothetical protein Hanom_Chr17g01539541 [Helianthus anomalus]